MPQTHPPTPALTSLADRVRGVRMLESLTALLDRARGSREALPHLAALEVGLDKQGIAAIDTIPMVWRSRMCAQLSSLPLPEDDLPLQDLLNHLLPTAAPVSPSAAAATGPSTDFGMQKTVDVKEISHSEFMSIAESPSTGANHQS